jgi:hypothetical protein
MRRSVGQIMLLITGLLACPCVSLPLGAALLSGTVAGAWMGKHLGVVTGLATGYFVAAVGLSLWLGLRHTAYPTQEEER